MGLTHPISSKSLYRCGNQHFKIGAATMQGFREEMEDTHTIITSMKNHQNHAFFAVFDGHCGSQCSEWCAENLYKRIDDLDEFTEDNITNVCLSADSDFMKINASSGCAAVFVIVDYSNADEYKLMVCNIGDSRILLGRTSAGIVEPLTNDHKPKNEKEKSRIIAAGGSVSMDRVDGQLALSRAIGDAAFKLNTNLPLQEQKVISVPEYTYAEMESSDFLLLCCDGLFESLTNTQIFTYVSEFINNKDSYQSQDLALICAKLEDYALNKGSKDNMTAMLVLPICGENYAQDKCEYLPGYIYSRDNTFLKHYKKDASLHGYSFEDAIELLKSNSENQYYVAMPYDDKSMTP